MCKTARKRILSFFMVIIMMGTLFPTASIATKRDLIYVSVSYDETYINDKSGHPLVHVPVSLTDVASVDLNEYGLGEYLYDEDGDGTPEITALQLVIYAHENLYGGDWSDVTFTGAPGSSYFQGGIFGFDENLNYFLNGEYPLASEGWGATSDQIVLEAGDFLDIGSFTSWDFYADSNYGFHYFIDENDEITHAYAVEANTNLPIKLVRSYSGMGTGAMILDEPEYTVSYGHAYGNASGTVTTDGSGYAEITFPSAGTWYLWADGGYGLEYPTSIVSTPAYAEVTVTAEEPVPPDPQDVSGVLNATMAELASTVTEPTFGTSAGEWTVFSLARGGYYEKNSVYFNDYYTRIVETVNVEAAAVNMNGALHKKKSTENSRLIVTLSAIGKNATSVGDWNLVEAYSANGFDWIQNQGLNGTIWALIALDSNNYETSDTSIRQQCVTAILNAQHDDGGWALTANKAYASDPDVTGMALTALYPYRDQEGVQTACENALACLSKMQHENGTFSSSGSECSESCAWVIIACTTWGINPDTDSRFIKNDNSVVDALLAHYIEDEAMFQHIIGAGSNAMATDQSCYALVAYNRLLKNKPALYDYSDVVIDDPIDPLPPEPVPPANEGVHASLGLPEKVSGTKGSTFKANLNVDKWDNTSAYKMVDFIMNVPNDLNVTNVTPASTLTGGEVSWHLKDGKLRVVYFDANENNSLQVNSTTFPATLFTIGFEVMEDMVADPGQGSVQLNISMDGMSLKTSSDSSAESAITIVGTENAYGWVEFVVGVTYSAVCLYTGDGVDLIPATKKAVAVAVTNIDETLALSYNDGTNQIEFKYNPEITAKTGIVTYVALVDASIAMENFVNEENFVVGSKRAEDFAFGDINDDGVINAQDALGAVDFWLRKTEITSDTQILAGNINGDSRLNTFDALGIVEAFVNKSEYAVVTNAAILATRS